jgi:hypothetical protein
MRIHYLFEDAKQGYLKAQHDPNFPYLNSASGRLAGINPGQVLHAHGHDVHYHFVNKNTGVRNDIDFQSGDIVSCIRNYYTEMVETAKLAKEAGAFIFKQLNDPHILSTEDSLKEARQSHTDLFHLADGVIACSPSLAQLASQYNQNVEIIYDGVDTNFAAPDFKLNKGEPLKLVTACYPPHHKNIAASLPSIDKFSQSYGDIEYTILTKLPRADQIHHGNDFHKLSSYTPDAQGFKITLLEYSPQATIQAIHDSHIGLVQEGIGGEPGYKGEWYPRKSNGRGACLIWAGKPFFCPSDVFSYTPFLNINGGYNIERNVGKTLDMIVNMSPDRINQDIIAGQHFIHERNSNEAVAQNQFDLFSKIREDHGYTDHGIRPLVPSLIY